MNPTLRRPIIRIALLVMAWCCGFLFYVLAGNSIGAGWAECSAGEWMFSKWQGVAALLQDRISGMGLREDTYGQIVALTLGNREFLSPAMKQIYREAGASHLLALSGMHLTILYSMMSMAVRQFLYTRWRWIVFGITMAVVWSYAVMTGCPKSLIRAALMLSLALLIQMSGERRNPMDILVVSAAMVLLTDPASLADISFQLSCAAMTGIIMIGIPLTERFVSMPCLLRYTFDTLVISVSAQIATMPLTLWYFGSIATYSALTSLIAIPLTMLIVYLSIGIYAGFGWCVPVVEAVMYCQNRVMTFVASLPGAYITL